MMAGHLKAMEEGEVMKIAHPLLTMKNWRSVYRAIIEPYLEQSDLRSNPLIFIETRVQLIGFPSTICGLAP
jgi:hypothetical protein